MDAFFLILLLIGTLAGLVVITSSRQRRPDFEPTPMLSLNSVSVPIESLGSDRVPPTATGPPGLALAMLAFGNSLAGIRRRLGNSVRSLDQFCLPALVPMLHRPAMS